MRKCDKYRELMNLALDDAITEYERKRLNDHLASCPECRLVNEALKSISEAISEDMVEPPECLAKNVMREIKAHRHFSWKGFAAIAACFVLIASAVGVGLVQNRNAVGGDSESISVHDQFPDASSDDTGAYDPDALSADAGRERGPGSSGDETELYGMGDGEEESTSDTTASEKAPNSGADAPSSSQSEPTREEQPGVPQEPNDGSVTLMDVPSDVFEKMVSAEIYFSGSVSSSEPDVTLTDAGELEVLSELLAYESVSGIPVPDSEALFTVIAVDESGERTEIRVWRSNLQLLMEFDGELYTVSGVLEDLLALIGW